MLRKEDQTSPRDSRSVITHSKRSLDSVEYLLEEEDICVTDIAMPCPGTSCHVYGLRSSKVLTDSGDATWEGVSSHLTPL